MKVLASYKGKATKAIIKKYVKDHEGKLNGIDVSKVEIRYLPEQTNYSAHRVTLESISTDKQLESVTDEGIKNILRKHLAKYGNKYDEAFSPSGIEELNANIIELNNGHDHKPIRNVRIKETCSAKFALGENGSKKKALVEAEKGTNLFFAIYQDEDGKRYFKTISLREAICNKKLKLPTAQPFDEKGHRLLFVLSPGDLVYIPQENEHVCLPIDTKRIYKMVSAYQYQCFFIPQSIALALQNNKELGSNNKSENDWDGMQIKKVCVKLETDRLGNIIKLIGSD